MIDGTAGSPSPAGGGLVMDGTATYNTTPASPVPTSLGTWSLDNTSQTIGSVTSQNFTLAAGDVLIVSFAASLNSGTNPSGCTWNGIAMTNDKQRTSNFCHASTWSLKIATGATAPVFISFSGTNTMGAIIGLATKVTGLVGTPFNGIDKTMSAAGVNTTPDSGATPTTTNANEYVHGFVSTLGPPSDTPGTWQNGFTNRQRAGLNPTFFKVTGNDANQVATSTGVFQAKKTGEVSHQWVCLTLTYF